MNHRGALSRRTNPASGGVSPYDFGEHVLVLLLTSHCSCVRFILVV